MARTHRVSLMILLASSFAFGGCSLSSLLSSDDDDSGSGNGGAAEEPSYTGTYAGTVDVSNSETGESWADLSAALGIAYEESSGNVDVSFSILGVPSENDRVDGTLSGCSPGPTFVICSDREGSQLLSIELTFSSSTASGKITDSREQPDGQFKVVVEALGSFTKQ